MTKRLNKFYLLVALLVSLFIGNTKVMAAEYTITVDNTQDEINEILASATSQDNIVIQSGDYSVEKNGKPYHKVIFVDNAGLNFTIAGEYTELQFIVRAENTNITANDATINGNASTEGNPAAALFIEEGSVNLSGNLTLNDHNHGVRLGYGKATTSVTSTLTIMESAVLTIQNNDNTFGSNYYGNGYDDPDNSNYSGAVDKGQGNGTSGAAIDIRGRGYANIILEKNATYNAFNTEAAVYAIEVSNFTFEAKEGAYVIFDGNGQGFNMNTDYAGSVDIKLNNAKMDITNSRSNAITGQGLPYLLDITNKSVVNINENGAFGVNNFYIKVTDSTLNVNDNGSHGASNVAFDATNSTVNFNNNTYTGLNVSKYNYDKESTDIVNSTINANGNGTSGIRFYINGGVTNITKSTIIANGNGSGNGDAGVLLKGDVYVTNSTVISNSKNGYSLYDNSTSEAIFHVLENTVAVGNGNETNHDIYDDYNSSQGNSGNTIVTGGSLQVDIVDTMGSESLFDRYYGEINPTMPNGQGSREEVQFTGPINSDYTALTQFILHQNINKEVGGEGSHTFIYYDPTTLNRYDYTFRYNVLGEDLNPNVFGNAYIWTPVSIIKYDATEGLINSLGTAGKVSLGYGYTDFLTGLNSRYSSDITIFGNSLDLAEKVLPSAEKENYIFLGWYIPEAANADLASELAERGEFDALYELLVIPFTQSTKVLSDFDDLASGLEEITVYAKWAKAGDVVVNYVDEDGNELADEEVITGVVGYNYETTAKDFDGYYLVSVEGYETGEFIEGTIYVTYVYAVEGIGDVEDPEEPTDEPVAPEQPIEPPHTDVAESESKTVNNIQPTYYFINTDNKDKKRRK